MIAKHIPMRSLRKSNFASLVRYITDEQSKTERLGLVNATNCKADTLQAVIGEVLATQQANTRAKGDKTYHLIVSFPAGEKPEKSILQAIENRLCAGLGYAEHQRVSALHYDTDNLHIHIAVNKIHPIRNTMHEPYRAYRTLSGLCDTLENEYGLHKDNHQGRKSVSEARASDMERHAGTESLVSWIRRTCLKEMQATNTWDSLHQVMQDNGLEIRQRGNGLVIESEDGIQVKASTVDRNLSKPKLEKRLGIFRQTQEQAERKAKRRYNKRPVHFKVNTTELYARYQEEQKNLTVKRKIELESIKKYKDRQIEAIKRANQLRRSAIKLISGKCLSKKLLYAQAHQARKTALQSINQDYQQKRQKLYDQYKRQAWADWLKQQALHHDQQALVALRAREQAKGLKGNTIQGEGEVQPGHAPDIDNITKKGTIIFRTAQGAVRDDGNKLQISRGATGEVVTDALHMAMQQYGNQISIHGSAAFKAQIIQAAVVANLAVTFTDTGLEQRRQQLLQQENFHEGRNRSIRERSERGRTDRRSSSRSRWGVAQSVSVGERSDVTKTADRSHRTYTGNDGSNGFNKSHVASIGKKPPSFAKNCLRTLSALRVVRFTRRSEMLLPGDVSGQLEHNRTESDHQLRWGVPQQGIVSDAMNAVDQYIAEREAKRLKGFDIPKHLRYANQSGKMLHGGIRHVAGQALALLRHGENVLVLPIDKKTAQRMKQVTLGEAIAVTERGTLRRAKGRSQ